MGVVAFWFAVLAVAGGAVLMRRRHSKAARLIHRLIVIPPVLGLTHAYVVGSEAVGAFLAVVAVVAGTLLCGSLAGRRKYGVSRPVGG